MTDADNDEVRCRWARGSSECGEICGDRGLRYGGMQNVRSTFSLEKKKRSLRGALQGGEKYWGWRSNRNSKGSEKGGGVLVFVFLKRKMNRALKFA